MSDAKGVTINVMGREFRVAAPQGEEKQLLASVDFLNRKMREIRDSGKVVGNERLAIMTALNIAHEFLSGQGNKPRSTGLVDESYVKGRILACEAIMEKAISDQEKLF